jgi:hypothetical protein
MKAVSAHHQALAAIVRHVGGIHGIVPDIVPVVLTYVCLSSILTLSSNAH